MLVLLLCLFCALPAQAHAPLAAPGQAGAPTPLPTPAPRSSGLEAATALPAAPAPPAAQALVLTPREGEPLPPPEQGFGPAAAQAVNVSDDFSSYAQSSHPAAWTEFGDIGLTGPFIIYYGGGITDAYKRLEITDQTGTGVIGSVRSQPAVVALTAAQIVVNFQTSGAGEAGLAVGWKDSSNFTAILINRYEQRLAVAWYNRGSVVWARTALGSIPFQLYVDYTVKAYPGANGSVDIDIYNTTTPTQTWGYNVSGPTFDLRGRAGAIAIGSHPRVIFDDFNIQGEPMPAQLPGVFWAAPALVGQVASVNGESTTLVVTTTNSSPFWYVEFLRWDYVDLVEVFMGKAYGPSPFSFTFNSGDLRFQWNQVDFVVYNIDGTSYYPQNNIWLDRQRRPEALNVLSTSPTLTADGQSHADLTVEVRDSGDNLLPGVQVDFLGAGVTINPITVTTGLDGRATTTVTAGATVAPASISVQAGSITSSLPVQLVAGAPASIALTPAASALVADGFSTIPVQGIVYDATSNPVPATQVAFATTLGSITPAATTDAQGQVTVGLTASTQTGTARITAAAGAAAGATDIALVPGVPARLELVADQTRLVADGRSRSMLRAHVFDAYNHPVPQVLVTFATTNGAIDSQALTDQDGIATVSLVAGAAQAMATVSAAAGDAAGTLQIPMEAGLYHAYLMLLINSPAPQPLQPVALVNGNFESGAGVGWEERVNDKPGILIYSQASRPKDIPPPVSPPDVAWLGGQHSAFHILRQGATLPEAYAVKLQFSYWAASKETNCNADTARAWVRAADGRLAALDLQLCKGQATDGWRTGTIDLGTLRGQAATIEFWASLDAATFSNLFLDEVRLCSDDPAAPAGQPRCQAQ